jgi:hypothetical protein
MWLLELQDRKFRVLLQATARGRYWTTDPELGIPPNGEVRFVDDLKIEYKKAEPRVPGIVILKGKISITDIAGEEVAVKPYRAEYEWDKGLRILRAKQGKPLPQDP